MVDPRAQLWRDYKAGGCMLARERLIAEYAYLAHTAVGHIRRQTYGAVGYDDLLSCATLALITAVDKYDPDRGVAFPTYAKLRIRGSVIDAVRQSDWAPRRIRRNEMEIETVRNRLESTLKRPPDDRELANALSVTVDRLGCMQAEIDQAGIYSLDRVTRESPRDGGRNEDTERIDRLQMCKWLRAAIACLPKREMQVVRLYYYDHLLLKDIATELGISKGRVGQLHRNAIARMRTTKQ